jgi:hypothetical protein
MEIILHRLDKIGTHDAVLGIMDSLRNRRSVGIRARDPARQKAG